MKEFATEEQLAEALQVSVKTLQDWRYRGRGPAYIRVGGAVRYRASDVAAWLDEHTVHPGEPS